MMTQKTFRTYNAAHKAARGGVIVKIGDLYIVGLEEYDQVVLMAPNGTYTGNITLHHLDRLGNANYAFANEQWTIKKSAFPSERE